MSPYSSGASSSYDFILQTLEKSRFFCCFQDRAQGIHEKGASSGGYSAL